MAVAQGYGKTVTSGSVFAYDTGDIVNCYVGEPTANLIPSPTINALPTTGNSWGTYNTNQYCGNNGCGVYWDLATVSSISSNVVTTATAHGLRTFDVINPQTTGGGVTSGTQYFVKAISSTQFTLHAYNGSQDGSQGYINPSTGGFKVHDSIWLDQRVSINSSGFPTKWFGNPHQPNSGLVKEIRTNGYRNPYTGKLTDCIRLHIPRPTGVDGMAYGADASVTIGQTYTTSFWVKSVSETAVGRGVYFQHYNYGGPGGYSVFNTSFTLGPVGQWQRVSFSYTVTHTALISYWFPNGDYIYSFDLANIQIENKSHATPFIPGTRSATQGLLPLVGNSTIDLSNVSFDSNAQMTFDGTDDLIDITTNFGTLSAYTFEYVAYANSTHNMPIASRTNTNFYKYGAYSWRYTHGGVGGEFYHTAGNGTGWAHWVITYDGSTISVWENGVSKGTSSSSGTADFSGGIRIGSWASSAAYTWDGTIPVMKIYNRALSAAEVRQNYLHYKTRFNLS